MVIIGPGDMGTNLLKSFAARKDVEIGHLSAALCHLGNIATRVGRTLHFSPKTEQIEDDEEAKRLVRRTDRDGHSAVTKGV
jgi:hypothetical protein